MRCLASIGGTPCDFNLTATALPFELYDGLDLLAYTRPDYPVGGAPVYPYPGEGKHYYRASLGPYETLQIYVARDGDGLPLRDADGESTDIGFSGGMFLTSGDVCPANDTSVLASELTLVQSCSLGLNDTDPCHLGVFCSGSTETDELMLLIEADLGNRPATDIDTVASTYVRVAANHPRP